MKRLLTLVFCTTIFYANYVFSNNFAEAFKGARKGKAKAIPKNILKILPQKDADYYRVTLNKHKDKFRGTDDRMTQGMAIQFIDRIEMGQGPPERIVKSFMEKVDMLIKKYLLGKFYIYGFCLQRGELGDRSVMDDWVHQTYEWEIR